MTTGDFPRGKEFDCPDCLLVNGHPDAVPQINFCAYCRRRDMLNKLCERLCEIDNINLIPLAELEKVKKMIK